jgi:hypothetical protein
LHKRQCRDLAQLTVASIFKRHTLDKVLQMMINPNPSELPFLLKLSATTWTTRDINEGLHFRCLESRATFLRRGQPAPGDTEEGLIRLLKRATTELTWPELPEGTEKMFDWQLRSLSLIAKFGEPEAAVGILNRHVEDTERKMVAPSYASYVAKFYIYRLDWLLSAAQKVEGDEGKKGAYVAEAKEVMERAARSLRDLRTEDWDSEVRVSTSVWRLD